MSKIVQEDANLNESLMQKRNPKQLTTGLGLTNSQMMADSNFY